MRWSIWEAALGRPFLLVSSTIAVQGTVDSGMLREIEAAAERLGATGACVAWCSGGPESHEALVVQWARLELVHPRRIAPPREDVGSRAARSAVLKASQGLVGPISASWSHHGEEGAAIVVPGHQGVGIDVEPAARVLSPRLQARLCASSGWASVGIREWAMLEAAVKAAPGPRLMSDFRTIADDAIEDRDGVRFAVAAVDHATWVVGLAVRLD